MTQNTTAAASDSANEAATNSGKPTQTTTPATTQSVSPKKLINPTEEQLDAAKTSADQAYVTTHQPQKIEAVSGEPATASTGSLTISTNAIGSGTNAKDPITLTWKMSAKAGDVAQVTVPADTLEYTFDSVDPLTGTQGTTVTTVNADGSRTITDTFASTVSTTQLIQLNLGSIISRPAGLADVGKKVTKTITFSITSNNQTVQEPSVSFTQLIQPTTDLSTGFYASSNPDTVKALLPNQNYVFQVSVNEADGVQGDDQSVPRVNSVDNFGGSQITIPVPAGFILDTDNTSKINGITDGTTITQPGGKGKDVIIEVQH